ncbi:MAG: DUF3179 domain-containing protein [Candidatus Pacearchaeota archaeon]
MQEKQKKVLRALAFLVVIVMALIIFVTIQDKNDHKSQETTQRKSDSIQQKENTFDESKINRTSDGTKYIIHPDKLKDGGPPKGGIGTDKGIPAITKAQVKYTTPEKANKWVENDELVLALNYKGEKIVYPLQILTFHEIINEKINGEPLLITYCPLCGTGIAYKREISVNGTTKTPNFGTSGKLYNSNLVMYDNLTGTYWQQIDGKAIVGELSGQELKKVSIDTVTWKEWKSNHKDFKVLSKDTGFERPYGKNPYGGYRESDTTFFDYNNKNDTLKPKTVVYGIEINGKYKAYKDRDLEKGQKIEDKFANTTIEIEKNQDGTVRFKNKKTGEKIVKERGFWFSWHAFHPQTKIYKPQD